MLVGKNARKVTRLASPEDIHDRFKTLRDLHLALSYHVEAHIQSGRIRCPAHFGKWIDSLAPFFKEVTVLGYSTASVAEELDYVISNSNVSFCNLGPKLSLRKTIIHRRRYARIVAEQAPQWDVIGLRVPSLNATCVFPVVKHKPVFLLIVGNMVNVTKNSSLPVWKRWLHRAYWQLDQWRLTCQANQSLTFANAPYLQAEFPGIQGMKIIHTSTIWRKDIRDRKDCCDPDMVRLVCISHYLNFEKGFDTVIEAGRLLRSDGVNCRVIIVGPRKGDDYQRLCRLADEDGGEPFAEFRGHVAHGDQLFSLLDDSDILVVPSRWDCQPRVVYEGMARGLPVVASRGIRSFPMMFRDREDMYFVDPDSPEQIARAVRDIREDEALRARLIASGFRIASEKTLERSAELLLSGLRGYLVGKSSGG